MWYVYTNMYCMGVYFVGNKLHEFCVSNKIIHRRQIIYIVYTLFLTDSRNFIPVKYTPYMVYLSVQCVCVLMFV